MNIVNAPHLPVRPDWLALRDEPVLEPELPIVDAHHHLWERHGSRYLVDELLADASGGHRIVSTVYVQCRSMLRAAGPVSMRPVGEVEFANGIAAIGASGIYGGTKLCEAIVGGADLCLGDRIAPVLESMLAVSGGRLRGIRNPVAWHESNAVRSSPVVPPPGLMGDAAFRQGMAALERRGLSLDVWAYHTQLDELFDLAKTFPNVTVVVDHFGGPVGVGPYAGRASEVLRDWRRGMTRLAQLPNTYVKLGGAGMPVFGFPFADAAAPPDSAQLADAWRPYFETCVDLFGARRCMFESNFPVDKGMFGYKVLWNAFKRLAAEASQDEKRTLFADTAACVYRLDIDDGGRDEARRSPSQAP